MKIILCTLCFIVLAISNLCHSNVVTAESSITNVSYTKLLEMSDDEVAESFQQQYIQYFECGFGDSSDNDEEKFSVLLQEENNSWRNRFLSGDETPYFDLNVSEDVPLDASLTADAFGYPANWRMELYEGEIWGDEASGYWEHKAHAYRIYCSTEVFEDYELYIRMQIAGEALANNENEFSVIRYSDPFAVRAPLSGEPIEITTTTTAAATTTTTTTTTTTVTAAAATTTAGSVATGDASVFYLMLAGISAVAALCFARKRKSASA